MTLLAIGIVYIVYREMLNGKGPNVSGVKNDHLSKPICDTIGYWQIYHFIIRVSK